MLSSRQVALVQQSFAEVVPITGAAAAIFYARLFALAPDTRQLFRGDLADQGRKLFLTLAAVVDGLDRIESVVPAAQALATRHVGYGVREEHYAAVGEALVATLAEVSGTGFDAPTEAAWRLAYATLAECMIAAARATTAASPRGTAA